jgi:hypothetical protein
MYSEWCSLEGDVLGLRNQLSVLNRFPPKVAKEVSDLIVLSIVSSNVDLVTEKEVLFYRITMNKIRNLGCFFFCVFNAL